MGKVLAGRYEVLKQLATGGMATVHLARALGAGGFERLVAVKLMHAHIGAEPEFVTMFLDEARLAARIRHPNVVPTLDVQESPDGLFLVMEFIEGPSLYQLIKSAGAKPGAIPLGVALRLMIDTLAGLHGAHELTDDEGAPLSLVHRDVSPANVLIGTDGVARITDFGVARAEARLTSTRGGQLKGKIPYMPPEQLMSEEVDRRCDVYAAGVVLWEVLIGRRLFQADNDGAMLQKILAGPEASPRALLPSVPEPVDRVCMRALQKKREDRWASAAEFAEALEQAAQEAGVTIATARAVAAFVEQSGAYKKMHPKEIAALKSGQAEAAVAAGHPPSSPSSPSAAARAEALPVPDAPPGTGPSQVTSAGSALSLPGAPPRRRIGLYVGAFVASASVFAVVLSQWGPASAPAPAAPAAAAAPVETTPTLPAAPTPSAAPTVEPSAQAAAAAPSASAAPSVSAPPAAAPPAAPAATTPRVSRPAGTTKPTGPKPSLTSYAPDRL